MSSRADSFSSEKGCTEPLYALRPRPFKTWLKASGLGLGEVSEAMGLPEAALTENLKNGVPFGMPALTAFVNLAGAADAVRVIDFPDKDMKKRVRRDFLPDKESERLEKDDQ